MSELARLVGVTTECVRLWIRSYGLTPKRTEELRPGYKRYWLDRAKSLEWASARRQTVMDPTSGGKRRRGRPRNVYSPLANIGTSPAVGDGGVAIVDGGLPIVPVPPQSRNRAPSSVPPAEGEVSGGDAPGGELYRAKVMRETAQAEKLRLENAEKMGLLLRREDAASAWDTALRAIRGGLEALPERTASDVLVLFEKWLADSGGATDESGGASFDELRGGVMELLRSATQEVMRGVREEVGGLVAAA